MLLSDQQKYIISVLQQVKYIRLRQLYALTVQHYRKERFVISQHRMDVMLRQLRTGTNFVYFQEDVVCYGKRTVDERYLEAVDVMLGLELGHIGINCENEAEAAKTAEAYAEGEAKAEAAAPAEEAAPEAPAAEQPAEAADEPAAPAANEPVTLPAKDGEKPVYDPEAPNPNPVEAGPAVAPNDENGKFDPTKIADVSAFGACQEHGCKG